MDSISFYSIVKRTYKTVLPNSARKVIYKITPAPLKRARGYIIHKLQQSAGFDEIHDREYYIYASDARFEKSFEVIAESIMKIFTPKSVVDVGCGTGTLLLSLKKRGVVCRGLEYSSAALKICRQNGLDVTKFNLEHDILPDDFKADVVVSTDVAEHLPESCADRFVDILCTIADNVALTACPPSSTIYPGHVNEQPKEYWMPSFKLVVSNMMKWLRPKWPRIQRQVTSSGPLVSV
jgi:SAM-dependent methyltransferase